ncbi:MAG: carboxypeptidase-like regulatory domain-containing protein [Chitinophagaceae bacterium]|nr:carboxypeptidase-like regulatory domain-containing protein [Chitinophagaceae bacterium]
MKFMPAILFLCLCALQAAAQQVVSGKISNETGQPIAGCSVFISNTVRGTSSAADGSFRLSDFPSGKHDLVISAVGYETRVYTVSENLLPMTLQVVMKIKVKELENVTVEPSGGRNLGRMG